MYSKEIFFPLSSTELFKWYVPNEIESYTGHCMSAQVKILLLRFSY